MSWTARSSRARSSSCSATSARTTCTCTTPRPAATRPASTGREPVGATHVVAPVRPSHERGATTWGRPYIIYDLRLPCSHSLRQRMVLAHQRLQAFVGDVRVDLRRRDVGMAQHLLDAAQVGAVV